MKKLGTVIIGGGFGDEGKGLFTDFETRRQGSKLVSRFNGGGQAGHTVLDGSKRHVFGNFSAGTFAGANTYLSSRFLVNPLTTVEELNELQSEDRPVIFAHYKARVSTIYDMVLNSIAEISRGADRHGSCGLGINETVTRHEAGFTLTVLDIKSYNALDLHYVILKNSGFHVD
jgi:adenylosuccinate synthase